MTPAPAFVYAATVLAVKDGDTIAVRADLGLDVSARIDVRMRDVYAPELHTQAGPAARDHLLSMLPVGSPCVIVTERARDHDVRSFTRYVGTVFANGVDVCAAQQAWLGAPQGTGSSHPQK